MNERMTSSVRLEMTGLFLAWAGAYVWLLASGRYVIFLRPAFWVLLVVALGISLAFALTLAFRSGSGRFPGSNARIWIRLGVLTLPLLYLAAAQEEPLGSYAFKNRMVDPGLFSQIVQARPSRGVAEDGRVTLLEILQDFQEYRGKRIVTEGMVYRDEVVPENHFLVFRFLMVCCAADALPVGALVEYDRADALEVDSWVRVEGVLDLKVVDDLVFPHIQTDKVASIATPRFPYLYPGLF